jgi:hypothetical protein
VIKKNGKKLAIDPARREPAELIRAKFEGSLGKLGPLRENIRLTNELIDAVMYKLYGLTEEEIRIVDPTFSTLIFLFGIFAAIDYFILFYINIPMLASAIKCMRIQHICIAWFHLHAAARWMPRSLLRVVPYLILHFLLNLLLLYIIYLAPRASDIHHYPLSTP